jgi:hypothetical protein
LELPENSAELANSQQFAVFNMLPALANDPSLTLQCFSILVANAPVALQEG